MLYIYPYKLYSESAKELRRALTTKLRKRIKFVKPFGLYNPRRSDVVLNWGNSTQPNWMFNERDLNKPEAIKIAANKLLTFLKLQESNVPIPIFTTDKNTAISWNKTIVVRHTLTGHSGQGIEIIEAGEDVPNAPLYVQYKKKRAEFRVHVFKGEVIDTCQKKKRNQAARPTTFNTFIRSHDNGWVFCRDDLLPDPVRDTIAIQAITALGLDFGAIDMIYNEREQQYYILEVNTSPGLTGTTLENYVEAILK